MCARTPLRTGAPATCVGQCRPVLCTVACCTRHWCVAIVPDPPLGRLTRRRPLPARLQPAAAARGAGATRVLEKLSLRLPLITGETARRQLSRLCRILFVIHRRERTSEDEHDREDGCAQECVEGA